MSYLTQLQSQRIIVLGLGVSGLSTVRFLQSKNINFKVVDSRPNPAGSEELALQWPHLDTYFGDLDGADLANCDLIVISPGIALATPQVQAALAAEVEVIGDIELFARLNTKPVVAVTGSNGKSTVVTLAAEVLEAAGKKVALAGNIGTPVLDVIDENIDIFVLELSSFQLETTSSLTPVSACILNLCEDHMDRYTGMESYCAAKQRIYVGAQLAVFNVDDVLTHPLNQQESVSFGAYDADFHLSEVNTESFFSAHSQVVLPVSALRAVGKHNQLNALAVMALLSPFTLSSDIFHKAFQSFQGLEHRCQFVAEQDGVEFFNDSKATNVGATISSIEGLTRKTGRLILIAGGEGKGADFSPLTQYLNQYVAELICFGKDAKQIAALKDGAHLVTCMAEAVSLAKSLATHHDRVLLAPACASLDMYPNYMARGEEFVNCVTGALR
ncbi:UDP-N-acetylmuramoyl-L-alanine--D-glutamate ligase [Pseudoalteromonas ulvae]|uniref:UDP-N-acetylmuramoylalanine--D-glutamate ligase n=1 Tax=Pseudoalteromonas ulvae TaxID=107327 RepID=A0A244CPQ6_PSEDV|nr:UDP-N-acetylmuramoyl-L-alanine--D-glutamate ligase [Pseudoalteromonas ulvae]OUL57584.1 UDP-N-acetylmuramoyl-L-alanine--D-glutamate ligase [Pseudoalteromonas ulvae]